MTNKITVVNNVHVAGRGLVVRQLRILASQCRPPAGGQERPPDRTGRLSEICPDNMYQPLATRLTD